ncbi:chitin-binding type-4 domain-containing protein [Trichonephila inaurata madagascariensis]|uniref:Chitin-binding type-4 domain-containing protein n=1 Tax=Trichonephila inaurata madagascariensis TaxID=2747483 RepID=A0A8X7C2X9_9ARAC|nr:chitin-binding type-4 domain-containing protein [Trichonephila inaurata madagascariensis]
MKIRTLSTSLKVVITLCCVQCIWGHARLMEPPSRSSMWRHGYDTPKNYDDDGLYCGGMHTQWKINGGKCGVCGDPWHLEVPRPNENGGKYGNGIIVRTYKPGQNQKFIFFLGCPSSSGYYCKSTEDFSNFECVRTKIVKGSDARMLGSEPPDNSQQYEYCKYHVESHKQLKSVRAAAAQLPKARSTCKYCVFQCGLIQLPTKANRLTTVAKPWAVTTPTSRTEGQQLPKPWAQWLLSPTKINRWTTVANKPTSTVSPSVNKDRNKKKKLPTPRPSNFRGETFQEALDRIRKDPRLRWMLQMN